MNDARCTQARNITHSLDGQHQYVDRDIWRKYVHGVGV